MNLSFAFLRNPANYKKITGNKLMVVRFNFTSPLNYTLNTRGKNNIF